MNKKKGTDYTMILLFTLVFFLIIIMIWIADSVNSLREECLNNSEENISVIIKSINQVFEQHDCQFIGRTCKGLYCYIQDCNSDGYCKSKTLYLSEE